MKRLKLVRVLVATSLIAGAFVTSAFAADLAETRSPLRPCSEAVSETQFPAIGTSCITRKGSTVFQRVKDAAYPQGSGETGWKDLTSGRIVFDKLQKQTDEYQSEEVCLRKHQVLPSQDDWKELERHGIRDIMVDGNTKIFWSSTAYLPNLHQDTFFGFIGSNGDADHVVAFLDLYYGDVTARCMSPLK